MSDANRTKWMGGLTIRAVFRSMSRWRPRKSSPMETAVMLNHSHAALVLAPSDDKAAVEAAVGALLLTLLRWCHVRGIDPQDAFERAWEAEPVKTSKGEA